MTEYNKRMQDDEVLKAMKSVEFKGKESEVKAIETSVSGLSTDTRA